MSIVFSLIAVGAMIAVSVFIGKGKTLEASNMFTLAVWAWAKADYYKLTDEIEGLKNICTDVHRAGAETKTRTHYDEIVAMSIEELARWLGRDCPKGRFAKEDETESPCKKFDTCADCWLDWLNGEIEEQ